MFVQALREIRFHPGRLVATLLAIALSVGFMSAVSIFMATQTNAMGRMMALPTSKTDVVVEVNATTGSPAQIRDAVARVPGVELVERQRGSSGTLSHGDATALVNLYVVPAERFRWARLTSGQWPATASQVALSQQLADKLKVKAGDAVDAGASSVTVSGITDDAPALFMDIAYVDASFPGADASSDVAVGTWLIGLKSGSDAAAAVSAVDAALAPYRGEQADYPEAPKPITVRTAAQTQREASMVMGRDFDVMRYLLLAFSGVAALVGLIIIANTFTILLAQRRRQIGLLRAVGASGGQVRGRFLAEAVVLGVLGSLLGIVLGAVAATIGATLTKASWFGLVFPWSDLALEVGIGVALTVLAAMLPALRATRVAPLEALQPVATSEQVRRASRLRAAVTGLLVVAGAALAVLSVLAKVDPDARSIVGPVLYAVAGAMLLTLGVLGAAPLYVPVLLRAFGHVVGRLGATWRLAADNAVRNPARASATATALMLATGLIVTLQIGVATADRTVVGAIEKRMPVDLAIATAPWGGDQADPSPRLSPELVEKATHLPNVKASVVLDGVVAESDSQGPMVVLGSTSSMRQISDAISPTVPDGVLLRSAESGAKDGEVATMRTRSGTTATVTVRAARWVPVGMGVVSPATLRELTTAPQPQAVWLKLADKAQLGVTMKAVQALSGSTVGSNGLSATQASGSAAESFMIKEVLGILLLITTALLAVAVLIALIGVGNTLGLSVIERTRESALLRALGMQRASLRRMLLIEALLLAVAAVAVGVAAGVFFGWLGMSAVIKESRVDAPLQLGVDWVQTVGMIAVAIGAAALASVVPGRRAANATPTEALAAD